MGDLADQTTAPRTPSACPDCGRPMGMHPAQDDPPGWGTPHGCNRRFGYRRAANIR